MMRTSLLTFALFLSAAFAYGQTARVQVIHNSPDAAAATVDVYLNGTRLLDDFAFRTATPFIDAPAGVEISLAVAPGTSASVGDALATFPVTLAAGRTYVVVANGIVSPTGYTPAPAFRLSVFDMGREQATAAANTDVLVVHGSPDAPTVDVVANGATTAVDDASFGDFAGYLELPTADYFLNITDETGASVVASFDAPLATLELGGQALVVLASGFLNPATNSNGPAFGLFAALAEGGALVALPARTLTALKESPVSQLAVYPNPASDKVQINMDLKKSSDLTAYVTNMMGQVVQSQSLGLLTEGATTHVMDLQGLASGMYILHLRSADSNFSQRIQKR